MNAASLYQLNRQNNETASGRHFDTTCSAPVIQLIKRYDKNKEICQELTDTCKMTDTLVLMVLGVLVDTGVLYQNGFVMPMRQEKYTAIHFRTLPPFPKPLLALR